MEPEFFQRTGIMALGSRLRRVSDLLTQESSAIYQLQGINFEPRWFAVYYLLAEIGPLHVSDLAERIGQSHASVSQVAKEMRKHQLIESHKDRHDGRKQILQLSKQGEALLPKMRDLYTDVFLSVGELLKESGYDLWSALQAFEDALEHKNLLQRVRHHRKARIAKAVEVVDYQAEYGQAFRDINVEWIQQYFTMEAADYQALDHPDTYIIKPGGHILVALYQGRPIGVVALVKMKEGEYELAKMGVRPQAQGMGIGKTLGQAAIEKARSLGANRIYLESNTILAPAIQLYYQLGFKKLMGSIPSPYARSNIQMEMML